MGIRSMPWDEWIELDNELPMYHRIKEHRIQTRGQDAIRILDGRSEGNVEVKSARLAAIELVHEIAEYLHQRYPATFSVSRSNGMIESISITPLEVTYQLPVSLLDEHGKLRTVSLEEAEQAMKVAALLVQEDIAIMVEGSDGRYYFQGGAICLPGFWRMKDKIGLPLEDIHDNGNVPQYREKLHTSLERFFRRIPVDKPVIRNNYFVQVVQPKDSHRRHHLDEEESNLRADDVVDPEEIGWSQTTNGPEDLYREGHHADPSEVPKVSAETLRLRSERQSLRRLPLSGAVIFGIRTYVFPIQNIAKEREMGTPGRLASAVRSWPKDVQDYKGKALYGDVLVEYLEREQGSVGEVKGKSAFPF
ncbi:hypothetical protein C8J56DRAFT_943672 [Mycena floridula]|nr:hypothetical protein C8J56DRAFT_943672 [Mycena floridula]